jgi:hypothetical protein
MAASATARRSSPRWRRAPADRSGRIAAARREPEKTDARGRVKEILAIPDDAGAPSALFYVAKALATSGLRMMNPDRVYHVQHTVQIDDAYETAVSDLIFVDGRPVAVLAWRGDPGNGQPLFSVPLEPEFLTEFRSGPVTHLYHSDIPFPAEIQG